ncbi:hypothetical protein [Thalassotalea ganghwensis]
MSYLNRYQVVPRIALLFSCALLTSAAYSQCLSTDAQQERNEIPANVESTQPIDESEWMTDLHQSVSDSVFQSAVWFDSFFTEDDCQRHMPSTNARIRLTWAPKARDFSEFKARFRIKVKLPYFSSRMDLILSDDDENDQTQLPLETINSQRDNEDEHFSAAVRYVHIKDSQQFTASRIGISGGDIFLRSRYVKRFTWQNNHSLKFEPSVYYFLDDGLGSRLLLEYDYQRSKHQQIRVNYSIRGSESFSGIRWKHGLYNLSQHDETTASLFGVQVQGERNGAEGFFVDKYTLSYRYRFNAYKKWLYFEVEPFIEWPRDIDYKTTPGLALRVEGFFYKN